MAYNLKAAYDDDQSNLAN